MTTSRSVGERLRNIVDRFDLNFGLGLYSDADVPRVLDEIIAELQSIREEVKERESATGALMVIVELGNNRKKKSAKQFPTWR